MIVGLTGVARAGKDEVGKILVEKYGFEQFSPADLVRAVALGADPLIPFNGTDNGGFCLRLSAIVAAAGWEAAKEYPEVRGFLQRLGAEGVRTVLGQSTWTDKVMADLDPDKHYVNTSVRFDDEAQAIIDAGGEMWRITRPGYEPLNHASDAGIDDVLVYYDINNNRTLEKLEYVVDCIMQAGMRQGLPAPPKLIPNRVSPSYPPEPEKPGPSGPTSLPVRTYDFSGHARLDAWAAWVLDPEEHEAMTSVGIDTSDARLVAAFLLGRESREEC